MRRVVVDVVVEWVEVDKEVEVVVDVSVVTINYNVSTSLSDISDVCKL